jgi:hypothetical protein
MCASYYVHHVNSNLLRTGKPKYGWKYISSFLFKPNGKKAKLWRDCSYYQEKISHRNTSWVDLPSEPEEESDEDADEEADEENEEEADEEVDEEADEEDDGVTVGVADAPEGFVALGNIFDSMHDEPVMSDHWRPEASEHSDDASDYSYDGNELDLTGLPPPDPDANASLELFSTHVSQPSSPSKRKYRSKVYNDDDSDHHGVKNLTSKVRKINISEAGKV